MAFRDRYPLGLSGINSYVPGMQYSNAANTTALQQYTLGSPAASSDSLFAATLAANAAANTIVASLVTTAVDSRYGRTLIYTISGDPGATGGTIETRGFDYLGQPMCERVSGTNGSTAIQYGKKAFYRVTEHKVITASTNAVTYKIGTSTRLGLPYKGDVLWAKENGIMVPVYNRDTWFWGGISGAEVGGGPSGFWIDAPFPGYVKTLKAFNNNPVGSTNDPAITVKLGGTAITGLTVTVDVSAAGNEQTDTPTTVGYNANNRFVAGGNIEVVISDADTASGLRVGLELSPTQFIPRDTTDPATTTTGDPRGTYDPITPPDGSEHVVAMYCDNAVNASNNGGLHGIRHYFA